MKPGRMLMMTTSKETRKKAEKANGRIRSQNRGTGIDGADWGEASADLVAKAVIVVSRMGCAIQFSYTRDQGAYCIRIVGDGESPYNEYCRPTEDIDLYLTGLISDFEAAYNQP
jgi:hypothetical protein